MRVLSRCRCHRATSARGFDSSEPIAFAHANNLSGAEPDTIDQNYAESKQPQVQPQVQEHDMASEKQRAEGETLLLEREQQEQTAMVKSTTTQLGSQPPQLPPQTQPPSPETTPSLGSLSVRPLEVRS